ILRGVRQQQDEPGRFSICSRQAAVVQPIYILKEGENENHAHSCYCRLINFMPCFSKKAQSYRWTKSGR
ncbi:hypothetical protein MZD75_25485, partial [Escherichia coli]|nr:hypothetical protein [Escherichia coli]